MLTIYHNPRCTKSRECLAFIQNSKQDFEVINYFNEPMSRELLTEILKKLNYKPIDLIRKKETIWIEKFKSKTITDSQIIQAMLDFPKLMERPIVVYGAKAIVARPLEKMNELL